MKKNELKSGSALVVVLGMTAVLMMMAVAFSVLMRTERSGMTNLKHALTARQTTQTAIARVMSAIDESFVHPTNNWPIAGWWEPDPKNPTSRNWYALPYISSWAQRVQGTQNWQIASIVDTEDRIANARLLTDELSRHLSPSQLALIKSAKVDWVTVRSGVGASEVVSSGPKHDMTVARYAFLAFNTTGLLDMNVGPMTNGTDAAKQAAMDNTDFGKYLRQKKSSSENFIPLRTKLGGFSSYAEMWRALMGDKRYDHDNDLSSDGSVTPDLFNTFSISLDEVAPDGEMKLFIPKDTTANKFGDAEKKKYAKLALERFERIFADEDPKVKLASSPLPELTRAQLATQALVDYIDEDSKPDGGIWEDTANPLNYPCTEAVPMINQVYSEFEGANSFMPNETHENPLMWYREYNVNLVVVCRATYHGEAPIPPESDYSLRGEFEAVDFNGLVEHVWIDLDKGPADQPREFYYGGQLWKDVSSPGSVGSKTPLTTLSSNVSGVWIANGVIPFIVRTKVKPESIQYDDDGNLQKNLIKYYAFTNQEENGNKEFAGIEVLVKGEVVSATDGVVQAVPAPTLNSDDYWIRVLPGINPKRSGSQQYRVGWAFCLDPRFAYNTSCIRSYPPGDNYAPWLTDIMCYIETEEGGSAPSKGNLSGGVLNIGSVLDSGMLGVAEELIALEKAGNIMPGGLQETLFNRLISRGVFTSFGDGSLKRIEVAKQLDAFSNGKKIYPDVFHSDRDVGDMFINHPGSNIDDSLKFIIANKPMRSISEFGNLVIGPWETLSLFATFSPRTDKNKIDFHRVSDYFSLNEARFPKVADFPPAGINTITDEYLPAIYTGKLNLNPQLKVKWDTQTGSGKPPRIDDDNMLAHANVDPLAVLLASASIDDLETTPGGGGGTFPLSFADAKTEAARFYEEVSISGQHKNDPLDMFRFTSDIGNVNVSSNLNPVLSAVMATGTAKTDAERERFIGSVLDRLTTRGQSYLVVIRADAYSPKYGSVSAIGGTTLATEYALVELWRDSEPSRYPNGEYYPDKTAGVLPTHGWFIRSCRFFSP